MTAVKFELDAPSHEISFDYRGKDLVQPLTALCFDLNREVTDLAKAVDEAKKRDPEGKGPPPALGQLAAPGPAWKDMERTLLRLRHDLLDAQLWLAEAKRTHKQVWSLNVGQLRWLHRGMADESIKSGLTWRTAK